MNSEQIESDYMVFYVFLDSLFTLTKVKSRTSRKIRYIAFLDIMSQQTTFHRSNSDRDCQRKALFRRHNSHIFPERHSHTQLRNLSDPSFSFRVLKCFLSRAHLARSISFRFRCDHQFRWQNFRPEGGKEERSESHDDAPGTHTQSDYSD
jgi:hypothetical protein